MDSEPIEIDEGPFVVAASLAILPPVWRRALLVCAVAIPLLSGVLLTKGLLGPGEAPLETALQHRYCATRMMACEYGGRVGVFAVEDYRRWRAEELGAHGVAEARTGALRAQWPTWVVGWCLMSVGVGVAARRGWAATAPLVVRRDGAGLRVGGRWVTAETLASVALAGPTRLAIGVHRGGRWVSPRLWVAPEELASLVEVLGEGLRAPPEVAEVESAARARAAAAALRRSAIAHRGVAPRPRAVG